MLGPGVHRGTRCVLPSGELRSDNRGESVHDARVLRHALTPGPALLGTVRRGWERAPLGPLLRSAPTASLRLAWTGRLRPSRRQRAARTDPRRSCAAAAVWSPLPTPAGCAEKRRAWGGCVCRRTHALRDLACRSCLNGVRPKGERSEFCGTTPGPSIAGCPQRSEGTQTGGRLFFAYFLLAKQKTSRCAAGRTSRPPHSAQACRTNKPSSQRKPEERPEISPATEPRSTKPAAASTPPPTSKPAPRHCADARFQAPAQG